MPRSIPEHMQLTCLADVLVAPPPQVTRLIGASIAAPIWSTPLGIPHMRPSPPHMLPKPFQPSRACPDLGRATEPRSSPPPMWSNSSTTWLKPGQPWPKLWHGQVRSSSEAARRSTWDGGFAMARLYFNSWRRGITSIRSSCLVDDTDARHEVVARWAGAMSDITSDAQDCANLSFTDACQCLKGCTTAECQPLSARNSLRKYRLSSRLVGLTLFIGILVNAADHDADQRSHQQTTSSL